MLVGLTGASLLATVEVGQSPIRKGLPSSQTSSPSAHPSCVIPMIGVPAQLLPSAKGQGNYLCVLLGLIGASVLATIKGIQSSIGKSLHSRSMQETESCLFAV